VTGVDPGLRHRPLLFVDDLDDPELDPQDHHHLTRVLRVRDGSPVTLADGAGRWRTARLGARPEIVDGIREAASEEPAVTVAFAPVKGERAEWVVQKLTELGVDRIVLVVAERSVVRWDDARAGRNLDRLGRVAREAAMQSRRLRLPDVSGPLPAGDVLAGSGVAPAEPGGRPVAPGDRGLAIGPEGGWSAAELDRAAAGVALPGGILRAETAAVVAGALLVGLRQGLLRPV
jgi:16S rRNA (uracil1498-N3)-methyltransferase